MWCEKAIELVGKYLRRAFFNPNDLEARWHMMLASSFAGIGFGNAGLHIPILWLPYCRTSKTF